MHKREREREREQEQSSICDRSTYRWNRGRQCRRTGRHRLVFLPIHQRPRMPTCCSRRPSCRTSSLIKGVWTLGFYDAPVKTQRSAAAERRLVKVTNETSSSKTKSRIKKQPTQHCAKSHCPSWHLMSLKSGLRLLAAPQSNGLSPSGAPFEHFTTACMDVNGGDMNRRGRRYRQQRGECCSCIHMLRSQQ